MSNGIDDLNGLNWKLVLSLLACWILAFLSLFKGIKSLGKVSYITAIFPYIMLTALLIRGVTLPGSSKGIKYYIGSIDLAKLADLKTWIDAASQVYFCLGISQGALITLGKHNKFNYNHMRTSIFVAILDGFTGIFAGFVVFTVLGFMSERTGIAVDKLAVGGPGLSFIVYPEALSLMPFPWIWCIFFFLMMVIIGFGSLLSMAECVLDTLIFIFKLKKKYHTHLRFSACMIFFLLGLTMTTRGGYYLLNIVESYTCTLPYILIAALEAIALGWFYGFERLQKDVYLMIGKNLNLYWKMCIKYFTPVLAIGMVLVTIGSNSEPTLGSYKYPKFAHYFGWTIVLIIFLPLIFGFFQSLIEKGFLKILYEMTQPGENWKPKFDEIKSPIEQKETDADKNQCFTIDTVEKENVCFELDDEVQIKCIEQRF